MLASTIVATLASVGLMPTHASANEPEAPEVVVVTRPLVRIGVDHAVAERNGFDVRTDADGVEYAVEKGAVTTFDTRLGECGSSFLYFTAVDRTKHYTSIYTGFDLNPGMRGALNVDWVVHVIDRFGASSKQWHSAEASVHSWHKTRGFTASGATSVTGQVTTGLVLLWDGTLCYSHGPSASARL